MKRNAFSNAVCMVVMLAAANIAVAQSGFPDADFTTDKTTACQGQSVVFTDATLFISPPGPPPPPAPGAFYAWNFGNGATPLTASGKGPHTVAYTATGTKTVTLTVTNSDGSNTETKAGYITVSGAPTLSFTVTNVSANGGSDGAIDMTVSGGSGSYIYQWSTNAATQDISGLVFGTYNVTVTDVSTSCTVIGNAFVNQPPSNIPTLSEWGLIIFALLLLCTGAIAVWNTRYGRVSESA